jgi:hypothetical protein
VWLQEALNEIELSCTAAKRTTPHDMFSYMGLLHAPDQDACSDWNDDKAAARSALAQVFTDLTSKLSDVLLSEELIDSVVDKQAQALLMQRLPPVGLPSRPPPLDELPESCHLWCVLCCCASVVIFVLWHLF